ncbi:hypothetical protein N7478_000280 [Penicillium angulare]|uniref:uncharacterized protein n=1 Tax=Penicillium angulare TaxID=116970 RepID=UPI0025409C08|nr:uncharacterized protein N7478_000280 [Penicillium angulare]KAJ5291029.1 hypothetical protein N7478_000280 [Penicillium angulare]
MKAGPVQSRLGKWYPISFFIAAIVFFIIGGALLGTYFSSGYSSCGSYYYYGDYYDSGTCFDGNNGEFYGGIACLVIGGVLKLTAWILFIIWCVKRQRNNQTNITYVNNAPMEPYPQQQQTYAAPQPMYPMQQGGGFAPRSAAASPGPMYAEAGSQSVVGTPPPKEGVASATAYKYCGQCGTAANGRFCGQCGAPC